MCGIAGIVGKDAKCYEKALSRMVSSLKHRGPDGGGSYFYRNCALGHRRLDIIDLITGDQPVFSANKQVGLIFNGEIYGYKKIREKLTGYNFYTTSDTEVISALYDKYGRDFVGRLPGMFAFALWDQRNEELICARDRFGEKPFYYAFGPGGELIFASEIKAILASGLVKPVLSPESLRHYLKYLYVHPDKTIYKNIYSLPAAHTLIFQKGSVTTKRYWSPLMPTAKISFGDATEKFRQLLTTAVENQLIADVPVGALLSGGLDSTSVVGLASQFTSQIKTFSFGFEGTRNELPFAREAAKAFHTDHHEFLEKDVEVAKLITTMASVYDEPFADSSNIPQYLISQLARKYVKVALSGDGGDELLGGYTSWYKPLYFMDKSDSYFWPKLLLLQVLSISHALTRQTFPTNWRFQLEGLRSRLLYPTLGAAHERQLARFTDRELDSLGLPMVKGNPALKISNLNRLFQEDAQNYMTGDILVKTDRASMAWGLELRAPFLDVNFAEFCLSLPYNLKINDQSDKIIIREALKNILPEKIRTRGKRGFGAGIVSWLARPDVIDLKEKYLKDPKQKMYSFLPFDLVQSMISRSHFHNWIFLNLSIWMSTNYFLI